MSNRNGDKARHNRLRKQKIHRRAAAAALETKAESRKKVSNKPAKAASK
jgi:hypothetical protein